MATKISPSRAGKNVPPLVVIVGETASGKSELAIQIAERFNGEIVCADSWTVRREANIGSAKPSLEDRQRVPHHLLDIVGPDEVFTAAAFKKLANEAITDIAARGKLPIMVGGSGLYVDGVIYDYDFLPPAEAGLRTELDALSTNQLVQRLEQERIDLTGVDTQNKHRLIRLIETRGAAKHKKTLRPNILLLGIARDRAELKARITDRTDAMLAAGLEQEVRDLVDRYSWDCEVLKGVGYAQWRGYFEGSETLEMTRQKIIKANLDLAKRQRTWFRRNKSIHWLSTSVKWQDVVDQVTTFLNN